VTTVKRLSVLDVPVTDATMDEAIAILDAMIEASPPRSHSVYYVNAHTLNVAWEDPSFRDVLKRADRVFGDGTGVRWATRALHSKQLRDNVNGTDLTPRLFNSRAGRGYRYFLLGNKPERIERAAAFTQKNFPGWTLAGFHHGYLNGDDHARVIEQINASGAHMLLVGMGDPLQELWIDQHIKDLRVPICMGVGGLFDYWSGDLVRAPRWVRRVGYEWLHLLVRQPFKARRYLIGNPKFLLRVAVRKVQGEPEV
jgi:N-acetylglucosaminyldiphosphoundecaprenol N-acetyl-beta-D-mannosaminyltransferase